MCDKCEEWLKQADYDMDTADAMHTGGRYFYAIFMCHLSIEKGLKGLYYKGLVKKICGRFPVQAIRLSCDTGPIQAFGMS